MTGVLNTIAAWSVLAIWFFGALTCILWLANKASAQAWLAYSNAKSWLIVRTAMREYHERREEPRNG